MKNFYIFITLAFLSTSCSSSSSEKGNTVTIENVEAKIETISASNSLEIDKIKDLIATIGAYTSENKTNSKTPELLVIQANYLNALGSFKESLAVYEDIYNNYKSFENHSDALFNIAFITENNLHDKAKAESLYKKYMAEFPNGKFYKDAIFSLDNLYKTQEELDELFGKPKPISDSIPE